MFSYLNKKSNKKKEPVVLQLNAFYLIQIEIERVYNIV